MGRRAGYMYGAALARGPRGQVGAGLGQTTSTGTVTLIEPTLEITATGQEEVLDGVRIVFQMAPGYRGTGGDALLLPGPQGTLHGRERHPHPAQPPDPAGRPGPRPARMGRLPRPRRSTCSRDEAEVAFASHHWPTWGTERIVEFLSLQRDLYAYLHDQTLRMLNQGLVGAEIAEALDLPPALDAAWHARGYYGSVSHNVKAIYQRYMGWYDGNPAHLWQHPPVEAATRYVDFMGGADAVVTKARTSFEEGDLRWAAEVLNHVVFAEPSHAAARRAPRRHVRAAGLRRRERNLAQRLPLRSHRAPGRPLRHPVPARVPGHPGCAGSRAAVRRPGHSGRRAPCLGRTPDDRRLAHRRRQVLSPPARQRRPDVQLGREVRRRRRHAAAPVIVARGPRVGRGRPGDPGLGGHRSLGRRRRPRPAPRRARGPRPGLRRGHSRGRLSGPTALRPGAPRRP